MDKTLHLLIMYTMLVLMLLLLHRSRKDKRGLFLAAYALIEVLNNGIDAISLLAGDGIYEQFPAILFMAKPLTLLWVPFFWFYVQACFSTRYRWVNKHFLHLVPFALALVYFMFIREIKGAQAIADNMFRLGSVESYSLYAVDIALKLQYVIYNAIMIIQLINLKKKIVTEKVPSNLNSNIRWIQFIVYGYAIACTGAILTFVMFHFNWTLANQINIYSILYFFIFFFIIFYDTVTPNSLILNKSGKTSQEVKDELQRVMVKLDALLITEQIYLDPELNLKRLAEILHEKERIISHAINTIKLRNFKDYINSFRVQHACGLLENEKEKPIFEVMFESGFNNKGPFNTAFKKTTGQTPSEFKEGLKKME